MTDIIFGSRFMLVLWNLSINGSAAILAVLAVQMLIRKAVPGAPGRLAVWFWAIPLFRLLCPLNISRWLGGLSLLPWSAAPLRVVNSSGIKGAAYQGATLQLNTDIAGIDRMFQQAMTGTLPPGRAGSMAPIQQWQAAAFWLWAVGAALLLGATLWKYARLHQRLQTATLIRDWQKAGYKIENAAGQAAGICGRSHDIPVYESDAIATAIVAGFLRCRIYLPTGLTPQEREWVFLHEYSHIQRRDPLFKLAACTAVLLHWWNPLVWLGYHRIVQDLEIACDEQAIWLGWKQRRQKQAGEAQGEKEHVENGPAAEEALWKELAMQYANTLLQLSVKGSGLSSPLSFGESSVSQRIKALIAGKRPGRAACAAVIVFLLITAAALISNPMREAPDFAGNGKNEPLQEADGGQAGGGQKYGTRVQEENSSAMLQELTSYFRQLPQEISAEELARQGFVVESREGFAENGQRWDAFMNRFCEGYQMADSAQDENGRQDAAEAGSLPDGESTLLLAHSTIEGDWILEGLCVVEDGYVLLADNSRDAFRDSSLPDISQYRFRYLTYKEQDTETAPWFVFLTDEAPESFSYEDYMQRSGLSSVTPAESPIEAFILAGGRKRLLPAE